jgi:hypothetical protein
MLVNDPFFLSFDEIAALTERQIIEILFHPRKDDGSLDLRATEARGPSMPFHEVVFTVWRSREPDITDAQLVERFKQVYGFTPGVM